MASPSRRAADPPVDKQVPEPNLERLSAEEVVILESQVLIPFPAPSKHAYLGPIPNDADRNKKTDKVFPSYREFGPRIFEDGPFVMDFMQNPNRVFRSSPPAEQNHQLYLSWLKKVESKKSALWKEQGIFDLVQLSRHGPRYQCPMLLAAMHFWDYTTNSLHLKCGMLTPTLLDVAAITGLKPLGPTFDPNTTGDKHTFNFKGATTKAYIEEHHVTADSEVSDNEHLAFLTLWLSLYVFCSSSLQVAKKFISLAIQIHECREINLSQLLLGHLYEGLRSGVQQMKEQPETNILVSGPIWLFQLWLIATFEPQLGLHIPSDYLAEVESRNFEGTRLALLKPQEINLSSRQLFSKAFNMFLGCEDFTPSMAPFAVERKSGPDWFKRTFPAATPAEEEETNQIWYAYLTSAYLSTRMSTNRAPTMFGVQAYHPPLVARQFGFCQLRPGAFYRRKSEFHTPANEGEWRACLNTFTKHPFHLAPTKFEPCFSCTGEFSQWWDAYFQQQLPAKREKSLLSSLISAFPSTQKKKSKSKGTHAKEIKAFQSYFETVYDPRNLSRTVYHAARVLKQKLLDKLPTIFIPPYVQDGYSYALAHRLLKFPPLPTSELALAFDSPLPKWVVCGSLSQFFSTKAADRVVPLREDIYSFKGQLHVGIQHVQCLTPVATGDAVFSGQLHFILFLCIVLNVLVSCL